MGSPIHVPRKYFCTKYFNTKFYCMKISRYTVCNLVYKVEINVSSIKCMKGDIAMSLIALEVFYDGIQAGVLLEG